MYGCAQLQNEPPAPRFDPLDGSLLIWQTLSTLHWELLEEEKSSEKKFALPE
jgi:hypothetical protein